MAKRKRQFKLGRATRSFGHEAGEHQAIASTAFEAARLHLDLADRAARGGSCDRAVRELVIGVHEAGQFDAHALGALQHAPDGGEGALNRRVEKTEAAVIKACRVK